MMNKLLTRSTLTGILVAGLAVGSSTTALAATTQITETRTMCVLQNGKKVCGPVAVEETASAPAQIPPSGTNQETGTTFMPLPFVTVSTSPYIGASTAWDAADVLNQAGKVNEDLLLLQTRQELVQYLADSNLQLTRPIIEISGGLEGQLVQSDGYEHSKGDISLSTAELDFHGIASSWASGFFALSFDSSPSNITGTRIPNSRIFLSRGFVNFGNLDVVPIYFSIGQMYLPFGRYSSDMLTTPVTQSLARTDDRAAVLGFYKWGLNASIYANRGPANPGGNSVFKEGGFNASYKYAISEVTTISGGGGINSNLLDSDGMQNTSRGDSEQFDGFDQETGSNDIEHRVPAADIHGEFNTGPWQFAAEYISAIQEAAQSDLAFNGDGATPSAFHTQVERGFPIGSYIFKALFAYEHTWEALGANLPENSFIAHLRTSFWKNTIEAFEYRHDIDYSSSDTANGSTEAHPDNDTIFGTGKSRNIYIIQVGAYF